MSTFDREPRAGNAQIASSSLVWNAIVPVLAIALILGAPMLPALGLAAVASLAILAVGHSSASSGRLSAYVAPRRIARGH